MRVLLTALSSLQERPLRTGLTMLGIIIGVAAVYAMLTIGNMAKNSIMSGLDGSQARAITITPTFVDGRSSQRRPWRPFTDVDLITMRDLPGVSLATGSVSGTFTLVAPGMDWQTSVTGTDEFHMPANDLIVELGRALDPADISLSRTVVVLGADASEKIFGETYPIDQTVKIGTTPFKVIGIARAEEQNAMDAGAQNEFVLIPRTTARKRMTGDHKLARNKVELMTVIAETQEEVKSLKKDIDAALRYSRGLTALDPADFEIFDIGFLQDAFKIIFTVMTVLLGSLGSISLVVGGVGVMNIMLVTVSERTREIGLRMSLGARPSDILSQFLIEAIMLCLIAGLLGLLLGHGAAMLAAILGEMEGGFNVMIALLALGSAVFIGVAFGFAPAFRASRLQPVEALRHE